MFATTSATDRSISALRSIGLYSPSVRASQWIVRFAGSTISCAALAGGPSSSASCEVRRACSKLGAANHVEDAVPDLVEAAQPGSAATLEQGLQLVRGRVEDQRGHGSRVRPAWTVQDIHCRAMPIATEAVGKTYEPVVYAVGREKVREYAAAVGETNPIHFDVAAAQAAGHADVVAPPMFAVVYCAGSIVQGMFDPDLKIDFAKLVHGSQEFRWGPVVVAGNEITTTMTVKDISERGGMAFYVFETKSISRSGAIVSTGTWTNIVRGVS